MIYPFYGQMMNSMKGGIPMKNRPNIFVDVDNTIFDSTSKVLNLLNKFYNTQIKPEEIKEYNFKDKFPDLSNETVRKIFDKKDFYYDYMYINTTALASIKVFIDNLKCRVSFVTLGTQENLINKRNWIDDICYSTNIYYNEYYGDTNNVSDKTFVDMSGGIFIDDNIKCLRNSNADIKILLKNNSENNWNKVEPNEEIYIANDWDDVYKIVCFFVCNREMI